MFNRWIASVLMISAFATSSCTTRAQQPLRSSELVAQEHKAKPQKIFINGRRLTEFLQKYKNLEGKELLDTFKVEAGLDRSDTLTGFASLIAANLEDIRENIIIDQRNPPIPKGDPACIQAHEEKKNWHLLPENGGKLPEAFGKIVHYGVSRRSDNTDNIWVGHIDVCTWLGNNEYYVKMVFYITEDQSLRAVEKNSSGTFPDTLDFSRFPEAEVITMMKKWNWKLHAKGGAFGFTTARENGVDMDRGNDLFKVAKDDCFDMFFTHYPPQAPDPLPNQHNYCMGRCNTRIMNTGE